MEQDPHTSRDEVLKGTKCIACGLGWAPNHFSMHWWDIGETAGWVCTFCHMGRFPNDAIHTYRMIRKRLALEVDPPSPQDAPYPRRQP